jgi:hypothetical protein
MKILLPILLLFFSLSLWTLNCTKCPTKSATLKKIDIIASKPSPKIFTPRTYVKQSPSSMTDSRGGEIYATISIGKQIWMAENLRYNVPGSIVNPDNPSKTYGRMYELASVQTACPMG